MATTTKVPASPSPIEVEITDLERRKLPQVRIWAAFGVVSLAMIAFT